MNRSGISVSSKPDTDKPVLPTHVARGMNVSLIGVIVNALLAVTKVLAGVIGNSYALIADGIESTLDIVGSIIVWSGLRISAVPPDDDHPYGHGKAESLAGIVVSFFLIAAAIGLAIEAVREILIPHHSPAKFTLVVLVVVVIVKEVLFRKALTIGEEVQSIAVRTDAWHHRSDAITSATAFIGISIALICGEGYEAADDWATLVACLIIFYNGYSLLRTALSDAMDAAPPPDVERQIRELAGSVPGVHHISSCRVRKSGLGWFVDITVHVDGNLTVHCGHAIADSVESSLINSELQVRGVMVHIEPATET